MIVNSRNRDRIKVFSLRPMMTADVIGERKLINKQKRINKRNGVKYKVVSFVDARHVTFFFYFSKNSFLKSVQK